MRQLKKVKQAGALLGALLVLSFGTGCASGVRLSKRAIVQAVAMDYDSGGYVATLQLYSDQGGQAGGPATKTMEVRGDTLTGLLAQGGIQEGKQLFLGGVQLLLLGEELARNHGAEALRFFSAYPQIQPTIPVTVIVGEAGALLKEGDKRQSFSARGLLDTLNSAEKAGFVPQARLMDLIGTMEGGREGAASLLPLLSLGAEKEFSPSTQPEEGGEGGDPLLDELLRQEASGGGKEETSSSNENSSSGDDSDKKKEQEITVAGAALFQREGMEQSLSPTEARGFSWLSGKGKSAVLAVELPGLGRGAALTNRLQVGIKPEQMADSLVFRIRVDIQATLLETTVSREQALERIDDLEELFSKKIRKEVESALTAICRKGYDPLDLSGYVKQKLPDYFKLHQQDWSSVLQDAGYSLDVSFKMPAS